MNPPQVSAVIPTHNRSGMLRQALSSALDQDEIDLEVIVVDDGSSDDTPDVLAAVDDERVVVIRHDRPRGVARARNAGIAAARGEWIAFLDDDDLWAPSKLRVQLSRAADQGLSFSYSAAVVVDECMEATRLTHPPSGDVVAGRLLRENVIGSPSVVVLRRELIEQVGEFDVRLPPMEDWDLWIRAAAAGRAGLIGEPLVAYREHGSNARVVVDQAKLRDLFEVMRTQHAAAARDAGVEFGDVWLERWTALQAGTEGRRLRAAARYLRSAAQTRTLRDLARALGALGGDTTDRLGRRLVAVKTRRPAWLDRYA